MLRNYTFHRKFLNYRIIVKGGYMIKVVFLNLILLFTGVTSYTQEINKTLLDSLLKVAEQTHSEAVIIYKGDSLITESYFGTGRADNKIESMSCTKSIVGLAVACLLTDKLIDSLNVPVSTYYPEWRQGQKQFITIRHLLEMTSGLQNYPNTSIEIYPSPDFVQLALCAELSSIPGKQWAYNNKSVNLLAGVIEKISGKRMDLYIGERLFRPLGITDFTWSLDSAGNPHAMSGCQIKPNDFVKLGLLILNEGTFNNKVVIAKDCIKALVTPSKMYDGYGLLWWINYETTTFTIDDEIIDELKEADISSDFIEKMIELKGIYKSEDEFYSNMLKVFGDNPIELIRNKLGSNNRFYKKSHSGNISFRADGYLGNYIIIDPTNRIVAVRMISSESHESDADNFGEFQKLVLSLTN